MFCEDNMKTFTGMLLLLFLAACAAAAPVPTPPVPTPAAAAAAPTATPAPTPPATVAAAPSVPDCHPAPIAAPQKPAVIPGYTEPDPETGLHVTGSILEIDLAAYRLRVNGLVERPLSLTYDQLRCLPKVTAKPRLVCPGFFVDTAEWSGVPLAALLDMAGVKPQARLIALTSADGYDSHLELDVARRADNFLAYELMGKPVPLLHGFPLRAVLPSLDGGVWIKWLVEVRATADYD
jgi:DMSO/TMAO reductase YedYZ molybdopterin-dependent catalytic subunit